MSDGGKQSGIPCRLIGEDGNIFNGKFIVMESICEITVILNMLFK